jgi:uncharacterized membrane protein
VAVRDEKIANRDSLFIAIIWSVSLSLLLSSVFVSGNLRGFDINDEYRISSEVLALHRWNFAGTSLYNSVISIALLVPMVSVVSGLTPLNILQLIFPLIYSIVPLILYKIYRNLLSSRSAFLSTLLFMFFSTFYDEMYQLGRQEIAEVILMLLIWILLSTKHTTRVSLGLVTILTIGFVTAHYSLALIFLVFAIFSSLVPLINRRWVPLVNSRVLLTMLVVGLGWYLFAASGAAVVTISGSVSKVLAGVSADFSTPSEAPAVFLGVVQGAPGILHDMNRVIQYLVQVLLVLGFLALVRRPRKTLAETQLLPLMAAALVFLGSAVTVPFLAGTLQITRIYHISLLFISPCFVYGIQQLDSTFRRIFSSMRRTLSFSWRFPMTLPGRVSVKAVIAAAILFSYFLFTSGWVWAVTLDRLPTSLILDSERMRNSSNPVIVSEYNQVFIQSQDIAAASWLTQYRSTSLAVCSDYFVSYGVLTSYGAFPRTGPGSVNILPDQCQYSESYVYLSYYNNVERIGYASNPPNIKQFSISDIWARPHADMESRVFSDGAAIYT